jgi:molybdopterin-containing oxidoreductase family iron-sulfur binding subunit
MNERAAGSAPPGAEFPRGASEMDVATRRGFLQLLGASVGLASLAACTRSPPPAVRPYVRQPDDVTPGLPLHYATTMTLGGAGTGVLVTSREGRPIKIEGNPEHPASLGATGIYEQAAIYHLNDPQRARTFRSSAAGAGRSSGWSDFIAAASMPSSDLRRDGGAGLRFLVEPGGSPLLGVLRAKVLAALPNARFYSHDPLARDAVFEGAKLAFGRALDVRLHLDRARVIVALDADFLSEGPFRLRDQRSFADHRVPENEMSRLYAAESALTVTGAAADHRLRVRSSDVLELSLALLGALAPERALGGAGARFAGHSWVRIAAKDLRARGAVGLVVVGSRQPALVHAVAAAINDLLGSRAVTYVAPALDDVTCGPASLAALAQEITSGGVHTLVITAWNPVYSAPADLRFGELLARVPTTVYHGLFEDETAERCGWFLPALHELESWGDARSADGTVSLQQPLVDPLCNGVSVSQVLAAFVGVAEQGDWSLLREAWRERAPRGDFDAFWDRAVQRSVVADSAFADEAVTLDWASLGPRLASVKALSLAGDGADGIEIGFRPDARVLDGRFADCAWLQELPDPITKLTWSNALQLSPRTAEQLGLASEDRVQVTLDGRTMIAPVLVVPGHADLAASITLGYGRAGAEVVARDLGANAYQLRTSKAPWFATGATITKVSGKARFSLTQDHWSTEGRPVAIEVTAIDVARRHLPLVDAQSDARGPQPTLYTPVDYPGNRWAMTIDTSRCTGCSVCILACESENNILPVGAEQVRRGREMAWLRVDRYFEGDLHDPKVAMQPLACVHCEDAPCEVVCPVGATVHSDEGLNEMVYNRCVGTRYCSNNCPYKVRRFNFLDYLHELPESEQPAMNPEVTVRARGVMEKCSYCVQRIEAVRIRSELLGRSIRDGEVVTACEQACPSQAITFGSLHDPASRVSVLQRDPRAWKLLHELGTRPRTMHLARVRNPHPELG